LKIRPDRVPISPNQPESADISRNQPTSAGISRHQPESADISRHQPPVSRGVLIQPRVRECGAESGRVWREKGLNQPLSATISG